MNEILFVIHTLLISSFSLVALVWGSQALIALICLQTILANLFVIKPIMLCGWTATGADAFTIGSVFCFHLLQEFYGRDIVKKTIWLNFATLLFYLAMSQIHLLYSPHSCDVSQVHFHALLSMMPRLAIASLISYLISQQFDCWLYEKLRLAFMGNYLPARNYLCAALSQFLDTILFSILGLYGIIPEIHQVIIISFSIKLAALALATPFLFFARRLKIGKE